MCEIWPAPLSPWHGSLSARSLCVTRKQPHHTWPLVVSGIYSRRDVSPIVPATPVSPPPLSVALSCQGRAPLAICALHFSPLVLQGSISLVSEQLSISFSGVLSLFHLKSIFLRPPPLPAYLAIPLPSSRDLFPLPPMPPLLAEVLSLL